MTTQENSTFGDWQAFQVLGHDMARKVYRSGSVLCALSPPVSPRQEVVSRVYLLPTMKS
jgi:hypothetical protein